MFSLEVGEYYLGGGFSVVDSGYLFLFDIGGPILEVAHVVLDALAVLHDGLLQLQHVPGARHNLNVIDYRALKILGLNSLEEGFSTDLGLRMALKHEVAFMRC
jgi:hypothetical protein